MNKNLHDQYTSFRYLQPGTDYKAYSLFDIRKRMGRYNVNLSEREEERFQRLFQENLNVSLRDHGFVMPEREKDILPYCRQGYTAYSYEGLALSGIDAIFENFMDGIMNVTTRSGLKWEDIIWNIGLRFCDIAHQDTVMIARTTYDIYQAKRTKRVAVIPSIEAASVLENEIERIDVLYGLGIRCMGITYNDSNSLGSGLSEEHDGGLTHLGKRAVKRMNRLGMAIDISHSGDRTGMDVIETSDKPVLISHAGARTLWNTTRMKSDEILLACKEKGGVIGILAAPNTTLTKVNTDHCLDSVMAHFEYIANLVGIDHVAFGPDTFFGDHVALQHAVDAQLLLSQSHSHEKALRESRFVRGAEDPIEAMPNMVRWLIKHGYSDKDIAKVTSGNIMRVLHQTWIQ